VREQRGLTLVGFAKLAGINVGTLPPALGLTSLVCRGGNGLRHHQASRWSWLRGPEAAIAARDN